MMKRSDFRDSDIGRWVAYVPERRPIEQGRIKGLGRDVVFVVYHCNDNWDNFENYTGCATNPSDLAFL